MSPADLFVLSSFEEGFPRVLLEAMGFGLPIVSTAIHGVPEIARAGAEALLVPPGDSRAMADALLQLLEDREFARRLGRQAQLRVEENFTAERVLPGHLATISELVPDLAAASSKIPPPDLPESIRAAS
jgi:glycosyltransferase involved in cell wall biosynthesis